MERKDVLPVRNKGVLPQRACLRAPDCHIRDYLARFGDELFLHRDAWEPYFDVWVIFNLIQLFLLYFYNLYSAVTISPEFGENRLASHIFLRYTQLEVGPNKDGGDPKTISG